MNKKLRKNKGITLIALIITIVVLLILAGVAISSIEGQNIIGKSNEAAQLYKAEAKNENTYIAEKEDLLEKYNEHQFKLDGGLFTFIEGMTWYEWCRSEYNTLGLICNNWGVTDSSTYRFVAAYGRSG